MGIATSVQYRVLASDGSMFARRHHLGGWTAQTLATFGMAPLRQPGRTTRSWQRTRAAVTVPRAPAGWLHRLMLAVHWRPTGRPGATRRLRHAAHAARRVESACAIHHLFAQLKDARERAHRSCETVGFVSVLTGPPPDRPATVRAHERSTTSRPSAVSDTARPSS